MKRIVLASAVCAAAVALASCASLQHSWDQGSVDNLATLINTGQAAKISSFSTTPFLVDGEVILLKADVAGFWDGIIKAGYKVQGPVLQSGDPVSPDSYKRFADTMEVRAFFSQYVKKDNRILELKTSAGGRILLIMHDGWFSKSIQGFKGPY
jgi:hypothetical protein